MVKTAPTFNTLRGILSAAIFVLVSSLANAQIGPVEEVGGPIRLRQVTPASDVRPDLGPSTAAPPAALSHREAVAPGEFERFVQRQASAVHPIQRLGAELLAAEASPHTPELAPPVPGDYAVAPGDEILLTIWGSVEADLRLLVDRGGRIHVPRVGAVQVAGVRHAELQAVIERRVGQVFKGFQLSATLGQLRGVRVFVTGFVMKPGAYTVNSLSTAVAALLQAGGPAAAGSFRNVELRRAGVLVANLDLYDLLLKGDRSSDRIVQAGDVVHVAAVGPQVGVIGSVNKPAVVELRPGETVADALRMAGGFSAVADRSRAAIERLKDRTSQRVAQLDLPKDGNQSLESGDVLRVFSAVEAALPLLRQNKRVRIDGEVQRPAEYVLPEGSTLHDALRAAGGLTPSAFVFGTEFTRVSVRQNQKDNYDRALRDLEADLARSSSSQRITNSDEASSQAARNAATRQLLERLRSLEPSGRIVLQVSPDSKELPDLALEDGDRIRIAAKPTTVGVFGSVFNAGSYLYGEGRTLGSYLELAGGPTKEADEGSVFVVRANGQVTSGRQQSGGWWGAGRSVNSIQAEPGDTVFVPEEMNKTTFVQVAKDWTQILYQLGLGIAGIVAATR